MPACDSFDRFVSKGGRDVRQCHSMFCNALLLPYILFLSPEDISRVCSIPASFLKSEQENNTLCCWHFGLVFAPEYLAGDPPPPPHPPPPSVTVTPSFVPWFMRYNQVEPLGPQIPPSRPLLLFPTCLCVRYFSKLNTAFVPGPPSLSPSRVPQATAPTCIQAPLLRGTR